jgi:hypothetical protein
MNASEDATYCARHPHVETALRCGRCNTLICPRCLVQTPVGSRCPDCANVRRLPTIDVSPVFLMRGIAAALVSGAAVGAAWGYVLSGTRGFGGFFVIIIGIAIGWAIGESISVATNRKRSPTLQACAVAGCILAYLVRNVVLGVPLLPAGDLWGYVAAGAAAVYATSRLRA